MTHDLLKAVTRETGHGTDLWRVILAPVVWVVHFLVVYIAAAVFCESYGRGAGLGALRWGVGGVTALALLTILVLILRTARVGGRSVAGNDFDFHHNSAEERHRFLSHIALMLGVLSAIAVIYTALPVLLLMSCQ